jgi:hypothetical protein
LKRGLVSILLGIFFTLIFLSLVTAADACCEKTVSGDWCVYTDDTQCDQSHLSTSTSCEQTSFCQVGTCYTTDAGVCYANTAKSACEAEEGATWNPLPREEIAQCQLGCCVVGDQAFYVTEVKCKAVGTQYGDVSIDYDPSFETESSCLASVKNKEFGCCVTAESAEYVTREECSVAVIEEPGVNLTVEGFHESVLCSNDILESECAKQHTTGCWEGKIYWYDSCGNRENIYSSDRRDSYNEGYALSDVDSCQINGANDPSCGNCNYALGTTCGPDTLNVMEEGEYSCIDLNCEETFEHDASPLSGEARLNGESWCVYDSRPGDAGDLVGSRHYRHICINGEEVVEQCADYREEICVNGVLGEGTLQNLEALNLNSENTYVEAACRENRNDECNVCNDPDTGLTERYGCCTNEDAKDCTWLEAGDVGEEVPEGVCVPEVPPGLKFWSEDGTVDDSSDASVCNVASTECTATWRLGGVKRLFGSKNNTDAWDLIAEAPDGCTTRDWLVDQNTYCRTQGDCGAYYNFVGEAGYDGLSSALFDEEFYFDHDELNPPDLGDTDYLLNVDDINEGDFWGFNSPKLLKNPATFIGMGTFAVGGVTGMLACDAKGDASALVAAAAGDLKATEKANEKKEGDSEKALAVPTERSSEKDWIDYARSKGEDVCGKSAATKGMKCESLTNSGEQFAVSGYCQKTTSSYCVKSYNGATDSDLSFTGLGDPVTCTSPTSCPNPTGDSTLEYECLDDASIGSGSYCNLKTGAPSQGYAVKGGILHTFTPSVPSRAPLLSPEEKVADKGKKEATNAVKGALSSAGRKGFDLTFGETAGCIVSSGLPVFGLFQTVPKDYRGVNGKESADVLSKLGLTAGTDEAEALQKSVGKARSFGTVSKVMNVATLVAGAYIAVEYLHDDEKTITYNVECGLWQPPQGGDDCELCNNENTPCSEYKCHSLGASCSLVNEGTLDEKCVSLHVNDVNSPIIEPALGIFSDGITITETREESNKGYEIKEKIPTFTPVQLGISTDEPAQCKYSSQPSIEFEEMNNFFGSELYLYNHSAIFSLGPEFLDEQLIQVTEGVYNIYVKCSDSNGNANERDYFIRFEVDDTPDLTPPSIVFTSVESGSYMPFESEGLAFSIYTNEPSECRWNNNDTGFDFMDGEMDCPTSGFQQSSEYFGTYECSTTLTGVSDSEINNFFFRCKDQSENVNENGYKFVTKKTEALLEITTAGPFGEVFSNDIILEIETAAGADNGIAECRFSHQDVDYNSMIPFLNTNNPLHTQPLTLLEGQHDYYFGCQDIAGNRVYSETSFEIDFDNDGPLIQSLYVDTAFSVLLVETNEATTCEYAPESFFYGEGTLMTGTETTEHEASLQSLVYNIICVDVYGNSAEYLVDLSTWTQ